MPVLDIKKFRETIGFSQEELARELNVTRNTIINWEGGKSMPMATYRRVSKYIDEYLQEPVYAGMDSGSLTINQEPSGIVRGREPKGIPFWDVDFFNRGASFENEIKKTEPTYYMDAPEFAGTYAFRANTDAMEGVIRTGSIIFASLIKDWISHIEYGQIYLVVSNDGRKYLRYVKRYKQDPKGYFLLVSSNPAYDEFEMPQGAIDSIWLIHGHLSKRI